MLRRTAITGDKHFWRKQTQGNEWQKSASLLVIEFILDYEEFYKKTIDFDLHETKVNNLIKVLNKFCSPHHKHELNYTIFNSNHDINLESIYSVESQSSNTVVKSLYKDPENSTEIFFDYHLIQENNRWYLVDINI
jgi:hypothetical protein